MAYKDKIYTNPIWNRGARLNKTNFNDISDALEDTTKMMDVSHENLLLNSNFVTPVNQAGISGVFTPYSTKQFIDGWRVKVYDHYNTIELNYGSPMKVVARNATVGASEIVDLIQSFGPDELKRFAGRKLTASLLFWSPLELSGLSYISVSLRGDPKFYISVNTQSGFKAKKWTVLSVSGIVPANVTSLQMEIHFSACSCYVAAAKLEYGDISTLFYKESDTETAEEMTNVIISDPVGYSNKELLKCKGRLLVFKGGPIGYCIGRYNYEYFLFINWTINPMIYGEAPYAMHSKTGSAVEILSFDGETSYKYDVSTGMYPGMVRAKSINGVLISLYGNHSSNYLYPSYIKPHSYDFIYINGTVDKYQP